MSWSDLGWLVLLVLLQVVLEAALDEWRDRRHPNRDEAAR